MCFFAKWYFLLLCFLGVKNDKNCKKKCKNIQADIGFTGVDILAKLCVAYVFGLFQTMCLFVGWFVCLGKRAIFVFFACFLTLFVCFPSLVTGSVGVQNKGKIREYQNAFIIAWGFVLENIEANLGVYSRA